MWFAGKSDQEIPNFPNCDVRVSFLSRLDTKYFLVGDRCVQGRNQFTLLRHTVEWGPRILITATRWNYRHFGGHCCCWQWCWAIQGLKISSNAGNNQARTRVTVNCLINALNMKYSAHLSGIPSPRSPSNLSRKSFCWWLVSKYWQTIL